MCVCVNFLVFRLCKCSRCGWGTWQLPLLIVFPPVSAHCEGVQCKSVHIIFHAHTCGHSHAPFAFPLVEALVSLCFCAGFIIFSTVHSIQFCIVVTLPVQRFELIGFTISVDSTDFWDMEDIVDLGETVECPSTQVLSGVHCDAPEEFFDGDEPGPFTPAAGRRDGRGGGKSRAGRSTTISSQSQGAFAQKVRGPNWTEFEMLVLIGQKWIEWDGRHNSNQPSLAKFVYGTTTWKSVLAGCMGVVGFRARDTDQIINKWDGLIKDYKKLKDYIEASGSANWWGLSREEKKKLSKTRKMSLEFSEAMYKEMEGFVGKRQIFGRAADVVDTDRVAPLVPRQFHRSTPPSHDPSCVGVGSPNVSTTAASDFPTATIPGHDVPRSTGRKRKSICTENLVDFVKDFNHEYLSRIQAQDIDKRTWRIDVLAFDTAREARIAKNESMAANMDQKFYELEVERTKNLGNMTSALLMLAASMDTLTRCVSPPSSFILPMHSTAPVFYA